MVNEGEVLTRYFLGTLSCLVSHKQVYSRKVDALRLVYIIAINGIYTNESGLRELNATRCSRVQYDWHNWNKARGVDHDGGAPLPLK